MIMDSKIVKIFGILIGAVFAIALDATILALPIMLLWNAALVGTIDGVHEIGFWNALGISFLSSLLFKAKITSNNN